MSSSRGESECFIYSVRAGRKCLVQSPGVRRPNHKNRCIGLLKMTDMIIRRIKACRDSRDQLKERSGAVQPCGTSHKSIYNLSRLPTALYWILGDDTANECSKVRSIATSMTGIQPLIQRVYLRRNLSEHCPCGGISSLLLRTSTRTTQS